MSHHSDKVDRMADPNAIRHRLLEGVLLRLAQRPDAAEFVLRGGMLLRHWFRPDPRPVDDIDLVARFPSNVEDAARRLLAILSDSVDDGVTFDPERARPQAIWIDSGSPGLRLFADGMFGGVEVDFHIDVTFGPAPQPEPVWTTLATTSGLDVRLVACRPEAVAAHKLQAFWHRGRSGWRPKDLDDFRRLLERVPMDPADLRAAARYYLAEVSGTLDEGLALFGPESWWTTKMAAARWIDFIEASPGRHLSDDLAAIASRIAERFNPILRGTQ